MLMKSRKPEVVLRSMQILGPDHAVIDFDMVLPSGKLRVCELENHHANGKSTISMAMFKSKL